MLLVKVLIESECVFILEFSYNQSSDVAIVFDKKKEDFLKIYAYKECIKIFSLSSLFKHGMMISDDKANNNEKRL